MLDEIYIGNDRLSARWIREHNTSLGGKPVEVMMRSDGLKEVAKYLEYYANRSVTWT